MSNLFRDFGERPAVIDEYGNTLTYRRLFQLAKEFYQQIGKRSLVFSLCTNKLGSVAGYVACQKFDLVPLLLADKLDKELLDYLIATYRPDYIWAPQDHVFGDPSYKKIWCALGYILYDTGMRSYPMSDDLALLLTTSGSTGSPKLVRQSFKNLLSNTKSIVQYLELDDTERPITTLPMNYTYGLSIINSHLYVGATILLSDKNLMQREFWSFFKGAGATSFGGVPYTYEMLYKLRFFRMELPTLRYMTQAGGKLTPELHKLFAEYAKERGKKFIVMYGQTEATARMSYLPYQKSLEKYGSMGIAIPGGEFELIDVDGNVIRRPHVTGELVYKGENVALGYAECGEDLAKGDERHGVLVTGDMAQVDEEGYYYIVGRKKRFLKIFGNRVNLDEAERLLKTKYPSLDCACSGIDDKMFVFITDPDIKHEVKKYISEKTGLNNSAFEIFVVQEIPKNDSGKTQYQELNVLAGREM